MHRNPGGRQYRGRTWAEQGSQNYGRARIGHVYVSHQKPVEPRVQILSRSSNDTHGSEGSFATPPNDHETNTLPILPTHVKDFTNELPFPSNQPRTRSEDAFTFTPTSVNQSNENVPDYNSEFSDRAEEGEYPRSTGPTSLEDYVRVRTGTRKRSRRSRQQGVPKLFSPDGSESGHQGRSNARAKFLNLASVARNRFPQVGPEKQANLAYSPSTPSSLQKIEAGSDGSNLASQSFDGSSAFFDAPADVNTANGMFKDARHSNGDISIFQWQSEHTRWKNLGRIGQSNVATLKHFEMDLINESSLQNGAFDAQYFRSRMESGINQLKGVDASNQHSPVFQRLHTRSPLSNQIYDYQKHIDSIDSASSSSYDHREQRPSEHLSTEPRLPPQLSGFFTSRSNADEAPMTAFRPSFPKSEHSLSPLVDPFVAGKNHHLTQAVAPMVQHDGKGRSPLFGDGDPIHMVERSNSRHPRHQHNTFLGQHPAFGVTDSAIGSSVACSQRGNPSRQRQTHDDQVTAMRKLQEDNSMRRTVLHDPLCANATSRQHMMNPVQTQPAPQAPITQKRTSTQSTNLGPGFGGDGQYHELAQQQFDFHMPRNTLQSTNQQTPVALQSINRGSHPMLHLQAPRLTDEEVRAAYPMPKSPELWKQDNRPFPDPSSAYNAPFTNPISLPPGPSNPFLPVNSEIYENNLADWWRSGSHKTPRQFDYASRLLSVNNITYDANTEAGALLFQTVVEQLEGYIKGGSSIDRNQKPDYFQSQFVKPPAWCVEEKSRPWESMFGEQAEGWGDAPARIGRDPRYAPLPRPQTAADGPGFIGGKRPKESKAQSMVALPAMRPDRDIVMPAMGRFG